MRFLFAIFLFFGLTYSSPATADTKIAVVTLTGEINKESALETEAAFKRAETDHADAIILAINSPGGSVPAGFLISQTIESSKIRVACVVDGVAASMAFFILESCPLRIQTKRSLLMVHEASISSEMSGQTTEFENTYKQLRALNWAMVEHYAHRMKLSPKQIFKKISGGKEWWINWRESVDVGAIDIAEDTLAHVILKLAHALDKLKRNDILSTEFDLTDPDTVYR